ncbi:interleukin-15 [Salvelinus alpinus]|uniref:interleukin-15 n=1 Tax=Salvelinus alpinus TaxID=8036 RepID=UPI0039FDC000
MTGFLTVLFFCIRLLERRAKKRVRWICLFWGFHYYQHQCLNTELWNCFLILSCLSATAHLPIAGAAETPGLTIQDVRELQEDLKRLKSTIEKSDACLYAPTNDDIYNDNCLFKFMHCYLLELEVVLIEDMQVTDNDHDQIKTSIHHRKKTLEEHERQYNSSRCSPCEAQRVANSTIFLYNMERLLERIAANCPPNIMEICV